MGRRAKTEAERQRALSPPDDQVAMTTAIDRTAWKKRLDRLPRRDQTFALPDTCPRKLLLWISILAGWGEVYGLQGNGFKVREHTMRPIVTVIAWSICLCVCLLDTTVSCPKTAELIEMLLGI